MTDAKFWDRIAPKYAKQPIRDRQSYEYTLERTRSYLSDADHVLELGCGTGSTALLLAPMVKSYTASDVSGKMIAIGQEKARQEGTQNLSFEVADWSSSRLREQDYSVVLALNLLHLLPDLAGALKRIHDMLPPGGLFISKTTVAPEQGAPLSYWAIRAVLPLVQALGKAPFVAFRRQALHDEMIEAAGFEIIETTNAPDRPPNRYVVARRI